MIQQCNGSGLTGSQVALQKEAKRREEREKKSRDAAARARGQPVPVAHSKPSEVVGMDVDDTSLLDDQPAVSSRRGRAHKQPTKRPKSRLSGTGGGLCV